MAARRPAEACLYFAYGSNLSRRRLELRVGQVHDPRRAILDGYRLTFDKRGDDGEVFANLVAEAGARVRGVVYVCRPEQLIPLDEVEWGYDRVQVTVATEGGDSVMAHTYLATGESNAVEGWLDPEYLDVIVSGAREHALPYEYVSRIEKLGATLVRTEPT